MESLLNRLLLRAVLKVVAYPRLTLAIAGLLLLGSIIFAITSLRISTNQNKLFSHKVQFFRDFTDFTEKFPENEAIYVIIEPARPGTMPPVDRWTALASQIAARLEAMPKYVRSVDYKIPLDQLGRQGILFEPHDQLVATLDDIQRFAPLAKLWGEKPGVLTGVLGNTPLERFISGVTVQPPSAETASFVQKLATSWAATAAHPDQPVQVPNLAAMDVSDPSRLGYYYVPDETNPSRHLMLVRVYNTQNFTSLTGISEIVDSIRAACADVAAKFPDFTVGVTGRPALEADEMRTTDKDSHRTEIVALTVVFIGLSLMLRSLWLALAAELCLGVGIGWTFGYATLVIGELNLLSIVFIIALIGIGMDYLIQILAAYRRESRRYARDKAIWTRVFRYVGPPIITACLGAAGAFFVSIFTDFRGAADLGIIAGGGLLLCLLSGYTVLPALLVLFPSKKKIDPTRRYHVKPPIPAGWRHFIAPALWVIALIIGIPFALKARFNPNLLDLQAPNLGSVQLVRKLQTWSAVVLSNNLQQLRQVRDSLQGATTVASTESILDAFDNYDWLQKNKEKIPSIAWAPPSPVQGDDLPRIAEKSRRLADHFDPPPATAPATATTSSPATAHASAPAKAAAASLRQFANDLTAATPAQRQRIAARLSEWQTSFIDQLKKLMAQISPPPLDIGKLPAELRSHYVSADGYYALYIYPSVDLWKAEGLVRFMKQVESRVATVPNAPRVTGIASNIYHTTAAVAHSFYKATAYAIGLIFILIFLDLRRLGQTLLAISVVLFGLPMLVAIMGIMDVSWNFANFFGLPILIGAAHEYGVFLLHRYREVLHNPRRIWSSWDASDHALLLCAFVTSSSFGFFWAFAHHRGLRSLGFVMALGCACIYLTALLLVRPLLHWRLERRGLNR